MNDKEKIMDVREKEILAKENEMMKKAIFELFGEPSEEEIVRVAKKLEEMEQAFAPTSDEDWDKEEDDFLNTVVSGRISGPPPIEKKATDGTRINKIIKKIGGGADASEEVEPFITQVPKRPPTVIEEKPFKPGDIVYNIDNGKAGKVIEVLNNLEGYVVVEFSHGKPEIISVDRIRHEQDYIQPVTYRPPHYVDNLMEQERQRELEELKKPKEDENVSPIQEKKRRIMKAVEEVLTDPTVASKIVSELIAHGILSVEDVVPKIRMSSIGPWSYRMAISGKIYDFVKDEILSLDDLVNLLKKASSEKAVEFLNEVFESTDDEEFKREVVSRFLREVE